MSAFSESTTPAAPFRCMAIAAGWEQSALESSQTARTELDGTELVWLPDRFAAYIITVQGSARLRLTDGRIYEVGYNGNNGYPYTAIGKQMEADGLITHEQLSLQGLKNYFAQHPEAMDHYLPLNPRTVFFTERPGGPFGSLNQTVTPFATVATDKST